MKTFLTLLLTFPIALILNAQNLELPFFDDFSNDYTNWTTHSITGADQWHLSGDDGIDGGKCARFYATSNPQQANDDWLVSKVFNTEGITNIAITFKYAFYENGVSPDFYYTNSFDGNPANSNWTQIDKSFWLNSPGWQNARIEIENPGETFVFALRYHVSASDLYYFLMDNFIIESYTPPVPFIKIDSTEHFEYYTNLSENKNYYEDLKDILEKQYIKLSDIWNRPGTENVFSDSDKIKIYYSKREDINIVETETPNWKCSFHKTNKLEIFLSPISNTEQELYYINLQNMAINEFSQLAISHKAGYSAPAYFLEGFGLYESGFRPRRDSIVKYLNENPQPNFDFVRDTSGINNTLKRDLIISNVEGQILTPWSYSSVNEGASSYIAGQWQNYLKYFYSEPENDRIKFKKATSHFDFYGAESDSNHFEEVTQFFENACSFYIEKYNFEPAHRFNIVLCPTEPIGMALTGYSRFNGGAGCGGDLVMQLSPNYNFDQEAYDYWYANTSAHEFFHIFYNHFMYKIPGGFWAEGSANFSARHFLGRDIIRDYFWKIEGTFGEYAQKYNVAINLEHLSTNPNLELDIYYIGDLFFEYLFQYHGEYEKIKEFFNQGMDYSVFDATYEEIDKGYIHYLKSLLNYIPPDTILAIPFKETFQDFSNGWSKPSYNNPDNWQICDDGINGGNCTGIYINSIKNIPVKSWLISPPLNAKNLEKVVFSFDYSRYGDGSELEVFYTSKFDGDTEKSNWESIKNLSMTDALNWKNSGEITLVSPPYTLFIGIRYSSPGEQHQQVYIDNFIVKDQLTSVDITELSNNRFSIYPNPIISNSEISFQLKTCENVNLSIFDIQGRKICTLLDKKLNAGTHTVPLGNQIKTNGVYLCKLATSEGVSTLKLIVQPN